MTGGAHTMAKNKQVTAKPGGKRRRPPPVSERPPRAPDRKKPRLLDDGEQCDGGEQCDDNFEIIEVMRRRGDDGRGMRKQEGSLGEMPPRLKVDCDDSNADAGRGEVEDGVVCSRGEDLECERIGWGEIDAGGEDRLLLRSAAEALQWRLKLQQWMTDLARLIQPDG